MRNRYIKGPYIEKCMKIEDGLDLAWMESGFGFSFKWFGHPKCTFFLTLYVWKSRSNKLTTQVRIANISENKELKCHFYLDDFFYLSAFTQLCITCDVMDKYAGSRLGNTKIKFNDIFLSLKVFPKFSAMWGWLWTKPVNGILKFEFI